MRGLVPFRLIARIALRFRDERCAQTAAALSFSTLLGVVPMIAITVSVISLLPSGVGLGSALEKFLLSNLLPEKAGVIIARYVGQFASRAGQVTLIGVVFLAATAIAQMLTIEQAFNRIWRVKTTRSIFRRVMMHLVALVMGPLVFGGSLAAISFLTSVSLGLVDEPRWVSTVIVRGVQFVFTVGLFGLLYWVVPIKAVLPLHAACGGIAAALGFVFMQKLFANYVSMLSANTIIYGAFSAVPIFLLWLYLSWGVILAVAIFVAELPHAGRASP